jgi:hypothetical protein
MVNLRVYNSTRIRDIICDMYYNLQRGLDTTSQVGWGKKKTRQVRFRGVHISWVG